jgi:hypothetical protein
MKFDDGDDREDHLWVFVKNESETILTEKEFITLLDELIKK